VPFGSGPGLSTINQKLSNIFDPVTTGTRFVTPLHSEDMNIETETNALTKERKYLSVFRASDGIRQASDRACRAIYSDMNISASSLRSPRLMPFCAEPAFSVYSVCS
jgi:hypothetical protein